MCGRYALYGPVSRLREAFDAVPEDFDFEPRWNAAPMRPLHDRMPVILTPGDYWAWLNGATPIEHVQALVRPYPEAGLAVYPVGKAVGNVRNEGEGLIQPL